jgi:hypothetical protein
MSLEKELSKQLVPQIETEPDLKQRVATKDICGEETTETTSTAVFNIPKNPNKTTGPLTNNQLVASSKVLEFYDLENFLETTIESRKKGKKVDNLRNGINAEWKVEGNLVKGLKPNNLASFLKNDSLSKDLTVVYDVFSSENPSTLPEFGEEELDAITYTRYFYDLHFSVNVPVDRTTVRNNATAKNTYESEVIYNYYNDNFEKSYKSDRVNERILPNITVVTSELSQAYDRFSDHVYLADKLSKSKSKLRFRDYIQNYGSEVEGIVRENPEEIRAVERPFENVYVASSEYDGDYSESLKRRAVLPMASKLSFTTFRNYGELGRDIVNSGLDSRLMAHVGSFPSPVLNLQDLPRNPESDRIRFSRPFKVNVRTSANTLGVSEPSEVRDENITVYSLDDWLESYLSEAVQPSLTVKEKLSQRAFGNEKQYLNSIFLGQTEQDVKDLEDKEYNALTALTGMFFNKNYQDILKNNSRSIEEIFGGKKAHSETLFYIIKKRDFFGNLIQTFFINPYRNDLLELLDTQVKYGKQYFYQVIQASFVLGSRYYYKRVKGTSSQPDNLQIIVEPYPVVAEIDLFETSLTITDAHPMPPDVEFKFYLNDPEKALVLLRPGQGSANEFPVFIDPDDFTDGSTRLDFKKDDRPKEYMVYVTDERPRDYEGFAGKSKKFLIDFGVLKAIPISVEPNKDYWVTFRTKDVHNKLSNPTEVYQLRMIYENGVLLPTKRIYNFEGEMKEPVEFFKNFKVTPSELQLEIDNSVLVNKLAKDVTTKDIRLEAENSVRRIWNDDRNTRKFKIRITSKNSGKTLDINYKMLLERKKQQ